MSPYLTSYWIKLKRQINARSQRERILLLSTGLVVIWVMMFNGVIASSNSEVDNSEDIQNLEQEVSATKHELVLLKEKLKKQSNPIPNIEVQQLETILKQHNDTLNRYREKLIKPENVPQLIDKLLADFSGLTLLSIETLPPKELVQSKAKSSADTSLYRNAIKMTFTGEYKDLLSYVKRVESLNYPLWWDEIEYKITQFPQAKIVFTVYTLSEHKNWIGV